MNTFEIENCTEWFVFVKIQDNLIILKDKHDKTYKYENLKLQKLLEKSTSYHIFIKLNIEKTLFIKKHKLKAKIKLLDYIKMKT